MLLDSLKELDFGDLVLHIMLLFDFFFFWFYKMLSRWPSGGGFEIQRFWRIGGSKSTSRRSKRSGLRPAFPRRSKANLVWGTHSGRIISASLGPSPSHELFNCFQRRVSSDRSLLAKTCFYGVIMACTIRM